jgi:hypothetical protein
VQSLNVHQSLNNPCTKQTIDMHNGWCSHFSPTLRLFLDKLYSIFNMHHSLLFVIWDFLHFEGDSSINRIHYHVFILSFFYFKCENANFSAWCVPALDYGYSSWFTIYIYIYIKQSNISTLYIQIILEMIFTCQLSIAICPKSHKICNLFSSKKLFLYWIDAWTTYN